MIVNPLLALELEASLLKSEIEAVVLGPISRPMVERLERICELAEQIQRPVKPVMVATR